MTFGTTLVHAPIPRNPGAILCVGTDFSVFHSFQTASETQLASYPYRTGNIYPGVESLDREAV